MFTAHQLCHFNDLLCVPSKEHDTREKWLNLKGPETAGSPLKPGSRLRAMRACVSVGGLRPLLQDPASCARFLPRFPSPAGQRASGRGQERMRCPGRAGWGLASSRRSPALRVPPTRAVGGGPGWGCGRPAQRAGRAVPGRGRLGVRSCGPWGFLPAPSSPPRSSRAGPLLPPVPRGKKSLLRPGGRSCAAGASAAPPGSGSASRTLPPPPLPSARKHRWTVPVPRRTQSPFLFSWSSAPLPGDKL